MLEGDLAGRPGVLNSTLGVQTSLDAYLLFSGGREPYTLELTQAAAGEMQFAPDGRTLQWTPTTALAEGASSTAVVTATEASNLRQRAQARIVCTRVAPPPPSFAVTGPATVSVPIGTRTLPSTSIFALNATGTPTWGVSVSPSGPTLAVSAGSTTTQLTGSIPDTAVTGDQWSVTVTGTDSDGDVDSHALTLIAVEEAPDPTASCADFSVDPGASDTQQVVVTDAPAGVATHTVNDPAADWASATVSSTGAVTVTATSSVARRSSTTVSGTVTWPGGESADWTANISVPCLTYTATGGSISLRPGGSGDVSISIFGGCPGTTSTVARATGETDPAWLTLTLSGETVRCVATSTATAGSSYTSNWVVTPSAGSGASAITVRVRVTIVPPDPFVTACDIILPPNSTRSCTATVVDDSGSGSWSIENASDRPDWISRISVNSVTGVVSVARGAGGTAGSSWDYVLKWDDDTRPDDEDRGTITAGFDPIVITGPALFSGFRGEPATESYAGAGGSGTFTSVEVDTSAVGTGVTLTAALSGSTITVRAVTTSAAAHNSRHRFGLTLTDSTGAMSTKHFFAFRVRCPNVWGWGDDVVVSSRTATVTLGFQAFGGCAGNGTWALQGTYDSRVGELVPNGRRASVQVTLQREPERQSFTVVARYTDSVESDNHVDIPATVQVGNPLEFNLPAELLVDNAGDRAELPLSQFVHGAHRPWTIAITNSVNVNLVYVRQNVLVHVAVVTDVDVDLTLTDAAGRSVTKTITIKVRDPGCTLAYNGVPRTGNIGVYLHGRRGNRLGLEVAPGSAHVVRVSRARTTSVYDFLVWPLRTTNEWLDVQQSFDLRIVNLADRAVLATCSETLTVTA